MGDDPTTGGVPVAWEAAWETGRAAWPGVELAAPEFHAFVTRPQIAGGADGASLRYPEDLYLAAACLAGSTAATRTFDHEILAPARGAIRSIDASDAFVDEALQRLRASLLVGDGAPPKIADYAGRGPLRAWVGISAVRTALMMRRSQQRAREVPVEDDWSSTLALISTNNPELELLKRQYATAFSAALRDAVGALEPRLRAALRMSYVEGLSIDEIAAVYAVHRATSARWIQRACDEVAAHTRDQLAARLALSATEFARMTALVQSQLDVSLSQLLPAHLE